VSRKAILSADNSEKNPLGGRGSALNPAGELTALPRPPSWWWGRLLPSPRKLISALGLGPRFAPLRAWRGLATPSKNPTPALGLRPPFAALRPSFGNLPSLHPQFQGSG